MGDIDVPLMQYKQDPRRRDENDPRGRDESVLPLIQSREPTKRKPRPYITFFLILGCVLVFVAEIGKAGWRFEPFNLNPMFGPPTAVLKELGAKDTTAISDGEWWRVLTSMWLHAGVLHLLINITSLWRVGSDIEKSYGCAVMSVVYMWSGIFSTLTSATFSPTSLTVGASGAIFGLVGAMWGELVQNWRDIPGRWLYGFSLFISSAISLAMGLLPWLDNFAHIGGFVAGILAGFVFLVQRPGRPLRKYQLVLRLLSMVLGFLLFAALMGMVIAGSNANDWCHWCHYLSCVPTPWWGCSASFAGTCTGMSYSNGTVQVTCPNGSVYSRNNRTFNQALCIELCAK